MKEDINAVLNDGRGQMDKALTHLHDELLKIRTGKASPTMLSGLLVEYYGNPTPINQVANINASDARTLSIQPWEKSMLGAIEQSIFAANLGLTPMNDGEFIRINIPPLTEERRRDLVKQAKHSGEEAKVSLRNAPYKLMDALIQEVKDGYPDDIAKRREGEVDKWVHDYSEKVDKMIEAKEKDIMTV